MAYGGMKLMIKISSKINVKRAMLIAALSAFALCMPMMCFGNWHWENSITNFYVIAYANYVQGSLMLVAAIMGLVGLVLSITCLILGFLLSLNFSNPKLIRATKILVAVLYAIILTTVILWTISIIIYNQNAIGGSWVGSWGWALFLPHIGMLLLMLPFVELMALAIIYFVKRHIVSRISKNKNEIAQNENEHIESIQPIKKENLIYGGVGIIAGAVTILSLLLPMFIVMYRNRYPVPDSNFSENIFTGFISLLTDSLSSIGIYTIAGLGILTIFAAFFFIILWCNNPFRKRKIIYCPQTNLLYCWFVNFGCFI